MKIILLSGGSGTRLWPLSNDSRAKQFLKVLLNEENGQMESMVQRVFRQLSKVVSKKDIIVTTNSSQLEILRNQLGDISILVEPERRDTFPAIALASSYLWSEEAASIQEKVAIVSVDAFVADEFYLQLKELETLLEQTDAEIALLGIKPTYASSKYGYMVPNDYQQYMKVARFVEKPTEYEAQMLIDSGSYWNSGVFVFPLQLIYDHLRRNQLPVDFQSLIVCFSELPKISFDYAIVEHLSQIVALTYDGYWKDLGTWNTLTEEMSQHIIGNGGMNEDCHNTHIINELELPVKVLGVSNAVIAVSADGILVSDKPSSSKMKDMLHEGLFSRPMYEERSWGWHRVIDYAKKDNKEIVTRKLFVKAGQYLDQHNQSFDSKVWTIILGKAHSIIDNKQQVMKSGDTLHFTSNTKYLLFADEDTELIEIQTNK